MRRALVTGANGLVGAYLVQRLVADGWRVRALVRAPGRGAWLESLGAAVIGGDILDTRRVRDTAADCEAIFHAAAFVTGTGGWEFYRTANIEGTRNAIAAAERAGAKLVQVSSVAVYGGSARYRDTPTDEDTPLAPLPAGAHYARSKRESEALVIQAHDEGRIWATAVRPCVVYGRYDRQFIPRVARLMARGWFPLFRGGRAVLSAVHAANVADGAVRAVDTPIAGGRVYNLTNDFDLTVAEFMRLAGVGLGRKVRGIPLPLWMARIGFRALGLALGVVQGPSMARNSMGALDFLSRNNPFSSTRARKELGWSPGMRPEVGVPDAFQWWREEHARIAH